MYDEQRCTSHIVRCAQTVRVSSALIKLSTIAMLYIISIITDINIIVHLNFQIPARISTGEKSLIL